MSVNAPVHPQQLELNEQNKKNNTGKVQDDQDNMNMDSDYKSSTMDCITNSNLDAPTTCLLNASQWIMITHTKHRVLAFQILIEFLA